MKSVVWQETARVIIIGGSGAGKTTLGRVLSQKTSLPHVRQDDFQYNARGKRLPVEEIDQIRLSKLTGSKWIFDGNAHAFVLREKVEIDLCIWLDLPGSLRVWRILKRMLTQEWLIIRRKKRTYGQRFDFKFLVRVWRTRKKVHRGCSKFVKSQSNTKQIVRLRRPQEVREFIAHVG